MALPHNSLKSFPGIHGQFEVQVPSHNDILSCNWTLEQPSVDTVKRRSRTLLVSIDTDTFSSPDGEEVLKIPSVNTDTQFRENVISPLDGNVQSHNFLLMVLRKCIERGEASSQVLAFLIPSECGYVARSDFASLRMRGCEHIDEVNDFVRPRQPVVAYQGGGNKLQDFANSLSSALAGMTVRTPSLNGLQTTIFSLQYELNARLSVPWIFPEAIPAKRIAFIDGRIYFPTSKHVYYAAQNLGISLVLIDRNGHYLQHPEGSDADLREGFIQVDLTINDGLPQRIADAVLSYDKPIDGIATICDPLLASVARACEILGIPTNPQEAFEIACDKYKTRLLDSHHDQAFRIATVKDLRNRLESETLPPLQYPLILKPCVGNGSEGVVKVATETELISEATKALQSGPTGLQTSCDLVVESYIDGPELDANFVLWDGDVLFCEVVDDFPSTADDVGPTSPSHTPNFLETQMVLPSALPREEQALVKKSIHESLLRAGFRYGVFHCEARVRNSSTEYKFDPETGCIDLKAVPTEVRSSKPPPSVFLLEINARTAGYIATSATHLTYGIDLFGILLLTAVRDKARVATFSKPFNFSHGSVRERAYSSLGRNDFQHFASILFIHPSAEHGGVLASDLDEVKKIVSKKRPDLVNKYTVPEWQKHFKKGDKVPGPGSGELYWLVDLVVRSLTSREEALEKSVEVRKELQNAIVLE